MFQCTDSIVVYMDWLAHPDTDIIHNYSFFTKEILVLFYKDTIYQKASSSNVSLMLWTEKPFNDSSHSPVLSNASKLISIYLSYSTYAAPRALHTYYTRFYSCPSTLHYISASHVEAFWDLLVSTSPIHSPYTASQNKIESFHARPTISLVRNASRSPHWNILVCKI